MNSTLSPETRVSLYPIHVAYHPDIQSYALVRWDIDQSISANEEAHNIIRLLVQGNSVSEIRRKLNCTQQEVYSIIKLLLDVGYIKSIDDERVPHTGEKIKPQLQHISRKWFSFILYKPVILASFFIISLGTSIAFFNPGFLPTFQDYVWGEDLLLVFFINFIAGNCIIFTHELAHFISAKAVGAESRIHFSTRYVFLAFETEHYHLSVVPRRLRYAVYLSGIYSDMLIISLCLIFLAFAQTLSLNLGISINIINVILLSAFGGITATLAVYLETDLYNLLSDYFNYDNLYNDFRKYILLRIRKWKTKIFIPIKYVLTHILYSPSALSESDAFNTLSQRRKRALSYYSIFVIFGLIIATLMTVFLSIPRDILFIYRSLQGIHESFVTQDLISLIKSLILFVLITYEYILLLYLLGKKIALRQSIV
jgi:putative peptide zinc metalloprotease protein